MTKLLIDECARILKCSRKSLRDHLQHPSKRESLLTEISGWKVRTTYDARNGTKKEFVIGGITKQGADTLPAYGRLPRPFNICVAAHFYARHRIRILFPYMPCIVERFLGSGDDRYYPMELLELVEDDDVVNETKYYEKVCNF